MALDSQPSSSSSSWFAASAAFLVALGTQSLLDNVVPASLVFPVHSIGHHDYFVAGEPASLIIYAVFGFLGLLMGSAVAVRLTQRYSRRLMAMLVLVVCLDGFFFALSERASLGPMATWVVGSVLGAVAGVWIALKSWRS